MIPKLPLIFRKDGYLIIAVLFAILIAVYAQYPALIDRYILNDDVRKGGDELIGYLGIPYDIFFIAIRSLIDPILLSKIIPFFVSVFFSVFLFKTGKNLKNKKVGLMLALFSLLYFWSTDTFFGGLRRGFAALVMAAFLYYITEKKYGKSAVCFIISLFVYPPVALLILLTGCIYTLWNYPYSKKGIRTNRKIKIFFIAILILLLFAISLIYLTFSNSFGYSELNSIPEFSSLGRFSFVFDDISYYFLTSERIGISLTPMLTFIFIVFLITGFINFKRFQFPSELTMLLISGITLYLISFLIFPAIYYPGRFIKYSLPFFLISACSINLDSITKKVSFIKFKHLLFWFFITFSIIFFLITFIPHWLMSCNQPELYKFIDTKFKDNPYALIAGHPRTISCVYWYTHFNRRNFLIDNEFYPQFDEIKTRKFEKRTFDFFKAYYSSNMSEIKSFCSKYNITHIIIEPYLFSDEFFKKGYPLDDFYKPVREKRLLAIKGPKSPYLRVYPLKKKNLLYFEPYDSYIKNLTENKTDFILLNLPKEKRIFDNEEMFIFECDNIT